MGEETAVVSVKSLVALPAMRQRFDSVLGGKKAAAFIGSLTALTAEKSLAQCEPRSVVAAAFTAATLDLPINKSLGFAWIVPYSGLGQFQIGWKGYVQLALRTGQYARLNAFKVNAEAFGGLDGIGEAVIKFEALDETKPPVGFAVAWELVNGFRKVVYWPKERCLAHAKRFSQSYRGKKDSPWKTDEDAMCLKTVVSNGLRAWGPMSVQMERALVSDQAVRLDVESEPIYIDGSEVIEGEDGGDAGKSTSEKLTERLKADAPPFTPPTGPPDGEVACRHQTKQMAICICAGDADAADKWLKEKGYAKQAPDVAWTNVYATYKKQVEEGAIRDEVGIVNAPALI